MVENRRWFARLKLQVYRRAVSLVGADTGLALVKREPLLIVVLHDFFKLLAGERHPASITGSEQFFYKHPSSGLEFQTQRLGFVAQVF